MVPTQEFPIRITLQRPIFEWCDSSEKKRKTSHSILTDRSQAFNCQPLWSSFLSSGWEKTICKWEDEVVMWFLFYRQGREISWEICFMSQWQERSRFHLVSIFPPFNSFIWTLCFLPASNLFRLLWKIIRRMSHEARQILTDLMKAVKINAKGSKNRPLRSEN